MSLTQSQNYIDDPNYISNINQVGEGQTFQQQIPIQTPQRKGRTYVPSSKIKWRDIMKIDLEMISRTNDLSVLEYYLENIVYSDITEDEIQSVPEGNIVKLIKVCQFTIEYLLSTQQKLEANCRNLGSTNNQFNIEIINKDQQLKEYKDTIRTLKKEKKHNETVLLTYKNVIDNMRYHKSKHPIHQSQSQSESLNDSTQAKQRYYCKYCKGKKYSSEELLNAHLHKRHLIDVQASKKEDQPQSTLKGDAQFTLFEKKLETMKTDMEGYFKKFQEENAMKLLENQKKIEEDKQSKQLEDMGNNFRNTLLELKEFYMQNAVKPGAQQPIQISSLPVAPNQDHSEQMAMILKEELTKLNEGLHVISSQQDQNLNVLSDKINAMKNKEPYAEKVYHEEVIIQPEKKRDKEKEREEPILAIVPQHSTTYVKSNQSKPIQKRKSIFNAGPIESDYDNSDKDKDKKEKKDKKDKKDKKKKDKDKDKKKKDKDKDKDKQKEIELIAELKNAASNYNEIVNKGNLKQTTVVNEPSNEMQLSLTGSKEAPKKDEEPAKNYIDPKESFGVTAKTQHIKSDLIDEFVAFEEKYYQRDHELIQKPKEELYFTKTLPQNFNMSNNILAATLKASFLNTTKKNTLNEQLDYEEFEKEPKDEIFKIINTTLNNINQINLKNKEISDYYQSLQQCLDLKLYENETKALELGGDKEANDQTKKKSQFLKEKHDDIISEANNVTSKTNPMISAKPKGKLNNKDNELEEMDLEDNFDS